MWGLSMIAQTAGPPGGRDGQGRSGLYRAIRRSRQPLAEDLDEEHPRAGQAGRERNNHGRRQPVEAAAALEHQRDRPGNRERRDGNTRQQAT
jgi:hypothetical protein